MAGEIKHKWNGTVLTIISDSGTSSCDVKGAKGDDGCRGPQGRTGITLTSSGEIDTSGLATEQYVDEKIASVSGAEVDLSNYYTKAETVALIPDLTGYATKQYVTDAIANIDGQIEVLKNLQKTFDKTKNSSNGGIGGHDYSNKIKDLEKEKEK